MTNTLAILLYSPFLFISFMLLGSVLREDKSQFVVRQYIYFLVTLISWQILEILFYIIKDPVWLKFVFSFKLGFVAFLPIFFLSIVIGFYRLNRILPRWLFPVLYIIPSITMVIALTVLYHDLLRVNFQILHVGFPLTTVSSSWGPWFYLHLVYCELIIGAVAIVVFLQTKKLPKNYWDGHTIIVVGVVGYILSNFIEMTSLDNSVIDINLVALCVVSILFYIVAVNNGRADYLNVWRRDIFNYLDEMILIVDENQVIIEVNQPANYFFEKLSIPTVYSTYSELIQNLSHSGTIRVQDSEEANGLEIYVLGSKYPRVYFAKKKQLPNMIPQGPQAFVTISDVTRNRLLIERLRETAGIDPLTNMPNRYQYQLMLRAMDTPENLPFSIIIGDVNGLKKVNDEQGHRYGDLLIETVGLALQSCCPENCVAARIGGDEFAMLLPHHNEQETLQLVQDIRDYLELAEGLPFDPSVALGSATKTNADENINALINQADTQMYTNKATLKSNTEI